MVGIYHIGGWGCLSIGDMDGFPVGEILIIGIRNCNRTVGGANPACGAFFLVHVPGLLAHLNREVPNIARNLLQGGFTVYLAHDGAVAMELIKTKKPQVAIVEITHGRNKRDAIRVGPPVGDRTAKGRDVVEGLHQSKPWSGAGNVPRFTP